MRCKKTRRIDLDRSRQRLLGGNDRFGRNFAEELKFSGPLATLGFLIKKEFVILGSIIGLLGIFLVPFLYYYLQLKKNGQTVGKKLFKLKVIHLIDQDQLTASTIITREFIGKFILSLFSPIMLILYLRNAEKRAFHDHIASTRVIKIVGGK